jgi:Protein of unknown function (DUF2793)
LPKSGHAIARNCLQLPAKARLTRKRLFDRIAARPILALLDPEPDMSDFSTRLQLPYLAASQAQKHVTLNESLRRLDALVQLSVASATVGVQPATPDDGAVYILPAGKTGAAWGGMANFALAYYVDGAWQSITPSKGWIAYVADRNAVWAWSGTRWQYVGGALGALADISATQSIPNAAHTVIAFSQSVRDTGGWQLPGGMPRLTVCAGVSAIRLNVNVSFTPNPTGTRSVRILKNGASFKGTPFQRSGSAGAALWTVISISSGVIETAPGDYFEVSVFQDSGGPLNVQKDDSTWFAIEACG